MPNLEEVELLEEGMEEEPELRGSEFGVPTEDEVLEELNDEEE